MIYHVTRGNLRYLLACEALDETRVTTRNASCQEFVCCLLNCKAFAGSRVKFTSIDIGLRSVEG